MAAFVALLAIMPRGGRGSSGGSCWRGSKHTAECARGGLDYDIARTFPFPPENLVTVVALTCSAITTTSAIGDAGISGKIHCSWASQPSHWRSTAACPRRRGRHADSRSPSLPWPALLLGAWGPLRQSIAFSISTCRNSAAFAGYREFIFLVGLFLSMLTAAGLDHLLRAQVDLKSSGGGFIDHRSFVVAAWGRRMQGSMRPRRAGECGRALSTIHFESSQFMSEAVVSRASF